MHTAIGEGITFFDNAWDYHHGRSEELMGRALAADGLRKKVFLMTKCCERDYAGALRNLEESLGRLRTDYLDLWQFHEMIYDNDPDWIFEKGAIRAAVEAKKNGKVRFIGFTGHKSPRIHLKMLDKPHAWDTVQMPINVMDAHFHSFQNEVLPVCLKRGIGVIGMKSLGGGRPAGVIPSEAGISAIQCIRYALSQPVSTLVAGMKSMADLEQNLSVAKGFVPMSASDQQELLESVRNVAEDGRFERFKTSKQFDGPYHRKQHGFPLDIT
jgi:predicted aldo/keto reductase-like oxidoreductase